MSRTPRPSWRGGKVPGKETRDRGSVRGFDPGHSFGLPSHPSPSEATGAAARAQGQVQGGARGETGHKAKPGAHPRCGISSGGAAALSTPRVWGPKPRGSREGAESLAGRGQAGPGRLTGDDADGDIHVHHTAGEGGDDHAGADQQPSGHHHQAVAEAVAEDRRQRSWRGREPWSTPTSATSQPPSPVEALLILLPWSP